MSSGWLFAIGAFVTAIVGIGVALPVYGAILDGRYQAQRRRADVLDLPTEQRDRRSAA